ncbi:restriction endonuclease subunit S [Pseudanabaena galeata UHCC 0370]|uniref:Restriction endonuclease subunit S n=1 Tax=Pseudanabaena galeata UHCC 0370 TaxID=3110310 RepID=A0ABU5TLH3_9CYAN|nr:restriction endonuclease subunit S [Pseudanabaena galeata]MEA5479055.1 restriction endonuclease subunit S [Pseudanabaena galeata UHCC 0370]
MSDWKETTWGNVSTLEYGKPVDYKELDGKVPVYGTNGQIGFTNSEPLCKFPSVIVGRKGAYRGIHFSSVPFCLIDTGFFLKPISKDIIDIKFAYYSLLNTDINRLDSGSAIPSISRPDFYQLDLSLPPLKEQKQIADVLSCLDIKIENLRRQNETLEQIAQTLFKHWFIDFEFPNADDKPYKSSGGAMVASELGDIPEGWKVGKLGDEFEILMGQSPSGSSFNEDKQGMIFFQGRTDFGFRFPTIRLYTTEPSRIAEKFDVLVSVRAPVGDINLASDKCCIGRGLAAVKSKYKSYCLHKMKSFKKLFNVFESEGTVFGSINKQSFNSLESIIPTDKVIKDFEAVVTTIDQKFYVNDLQIQTLTKTRDSLLPKLMSGQLRVKEK